MFLFKALDTYDHFVFQKVLGEYFNKHFLFFNYMPNSEGVGLGVGRDEELGWKMRCRHE